MKTQNLGGVTIHRIVEIPALAIPLEQILPFTPREEVDAAARHFPPEMVDPETLALYLSFHSYLIRTRCHLILVDMCFGNDKPRPYLAEAHQRGGDFLDQLKRFGVTPEDIDFVLCTHLHADHVGWNTRLVDGRWVPTFPRARYVISRREYDHWKAEYDAADAEALKISAFADSVLPVVAAGRAVMVDGDCALDDAVTLEPLPGHSPGHQIAHVKGERGAGLLTGDTFHHPIQLRHPGWHTGFCNDPAHAAAQRLRLLDRYAETPTLIFPAHFTAPTAGRIARAGNAFAYAYVGD